MVKSSEIGKEHVNEVYKALLKGEEHITAEYIRELYPTIISVRNKFQFDQPDMNPDLVIELISGEVIHINLFLIKGSARIQPKNLGAMSFLEKYFGNQVLQSSFNLDLKYELESFYKEIISIKEEGFYYGETELRRKVKELYPNFTPEINPYRRIFLAQLRDITFLLLKDLFNEDNGNIEATFKELMMLESVNIISRIKGVTIHSVEEWKTNIDYNNQLELYKKGNDTFGIRIGSNALTMRFKFESSPATSIKLATSFESFPDNAQVEASNLQSITEFEDLIAQHENTITNNISNAIGKCNEAAVYYQILKMNPKLDQVNEHVYLKMITDYAPVIKTEILNQIVKASKVTYEEIEKFLMIKYGNFVFKSIELVPESYIKDRLDTTDINVTLMKGNKYYDEGLSLKAIANSKAKITVKNPGAGQILGPNYFDVGSLTILVEKLKESFLKGEKNHMECLEIISEKLGNELVSADTNKIRRGLESLIGKVPKVVTIYAANECKIIESKRIASSIIVRPQTPTLIQTTFEDTKSDFELSLRAKFSANQSKGWSSLKFAGEMKV